MTPEHLAEQAKKDVLMVLELSEELVFSGDLLNCTRAWLLGYQLSDTTLKQQVVALQDKCVAYEKELEEKDELIRRLQDPLNPKHHQ